MGRLTVISVIEEQLGVTISDESVTPETTVGELRRLVSQGGTVEEVVRPPVWPYWRWVRLIGNGKPLLIAEGIETALSAYQLAIEQHPNAAVWAALSTSGLRGLVLPPPKQLYDILICADGDAAGGAAADSCCDKWRVEHRWPRIWRAPEGCDFNDVLLRGEPAL